MIMHPFTVIEGDVTSPQGFLASGVHIGIKREKKDLAIIFSQIPGVAAGVFTTNKACAAPVILSKEHIQARHTQGIIINSGNANACTGEQGLKDAQETLKLAAKALGVSPEAMLVSSTGVIGVPMPMALMGPGIQKAVAALSPTGGKAAAEAIMTTDLRPKALGVQVEIDGKLVTIGGIAKGSGMIHPNMATMLAMVTTDCAIHKDFLQEALQRTTEKTYNMISVDGDTSTNDMVLVLANGLAGNQEMNENHPEKEKFLAAFEYLHEYLAKEIVRDGEGATKFIEVEVNHAPTLEDAKRAVKAVLNSNLVKTAFFGEDGNWGRILCSLGYSGANLQMDRVSLTLKSAKGAVQIVQDGQATAYQEDEVAQLLKEQEIQVIIDLNLGEAKAVGWGCDLSYDYVKINGAYRS